MGDKWRRIKTRLKYSSRYVRVFEDEIVTAEGLKISYTRLELLNFVAIVPIDEAENVVMIRNYRYPVNKSVLEIPSGHINEGERVVDAAKRELLEETGYTANKMVKLGWHHPLSRSQQRAYLFLATGLSEGVPSRDATEKQEVVKMRVEEIFEMMLRGELKHAPTIIALSLAIPLLRGRTLRRFAQIPSKEV